MIETSGAVGIDSIDNHRHPKIIDTAESPSRASRAVESVLERLYRFEVILRLQMQGKPVAVVPLSISVFRRKDKLPDSVHEERQLTSDKMNSAPHR